MSNRKEPNPPPNRPSREDLKTAGHIGDPPKGVTKPEPPPVPPTFGIDGQKMVGDLERYRDWEPVIHAFDLRTEWIMGALMILLTPEQVDGLNATMERRAGKGRTVDVAKMKESFEKLKPSKGE